MRNISLDEEAIIENDNICYCYYDSVLRQLPTGDADENLLLNNKLNRKKNHIKILKANFASDVIKPSYYVALDFLKRKLVIIIRGTESLRDSITDMQWRAIVIPDTDPELGWYGHEVS